MEIKDLSKTIKPKTDQLNADDLVSGAMTIKIRDVKIIESPIQPVSIFFDGDNNKPYKPSLGMRRVLVQLWGDDGNAYVGRKLTLFRDDNVKFGGEEVGGIRISHASHILKDTRVLETVSKGKRKPITIEPIIEATKEIFNESHPKWKAGIEALKSGKTTLEKVKSSYIIADATLAIIEELIKSDSND